MKIIAVDNFNRESVADVLVAERLTEYYAQFIADACNNHPASGDRYYKAVPDDHVLWRGMAELV